VFENLVSGLVSGLVATLLVVVFRTFWVSVITPWFEERVYKDIRIEGKWFAIYPDWGNPIRQEVVTLSRQGHAVSGLIVCLHGHDSGEQYQIAGSFRNMVLTFTYESCEKAKSDRGSIALKSVMNGKRLVGKIAFYSDNKDSIDTRTIVWFRLKEDFEQYLISIAQKGDELSKLRTEAGEIEAKLNAAEEITERSV
jgi:hypothetical protein